MGLVITAVDFITTQPAVMDVLLNWTYGFLILVNLALSIPIMAVCVVGCVVRLHGNMNAVINRLKGKLND